MTPSDETSSTTGIPIRQGKMDDLLLSKDQEILLLSEQIGKLQVQLEAATDNKVMLLGICQEYCCLKGIEI